MKCKRWNYIKNLKPAAPRMIWQSTCGLPGIDGAAKGTMNLGRNAMKRAMRADMPRKLWPSPAMVRIVANEVRRAA